MAIRRDAIYQGDREMRWTLRRFGDDFRELRTRHGVTQAAVARAVGVNRSVICKLEQGQEGVSIHVRARASACLGADFRIQLYPERAPLLFDAAHARMVERLLARRHRSWRATVEAPVPGPGRRSVDVQLERSGQVVLVEVETRVRRLEEVIRALHAKRAAVASSAGGRPVHVVLAVPPTRHHQTLMRTNVETLRVAFPVPSTALSASLSSSAGAWPGDGLLWIAAG